MNLSFTSSVRRLKLIVVISVATGLIYAQNANDIAKKNASKFSSFEKNFSKRFSSAKNAVRLIGFRTYPIGKGEKASLREMVSKHGNAMKQINMVVSEDYSFYRIYFPLHTAIVACGGKLYQANENGVFMAPSFKKLCATAAPIEPRLPLPVMIATLPSKRPIYRSPPGSFLSDLSFSTTSSKNTSSICRKNLRVGRNIVYNRL